MTTLKLASKLSGSANIALNDLIHMLYASPGKRIVGVVELAHIERAEPAPGEDKDASVTMQIKAIEIARGEQEHHLRQAMAALYRHRTVSGTIDDELQPKLSDRTIELTGGVLDAVEAARLKVVCDQWAEYIRRMLSGKKLSLTQAIEELRVVERGLNAASGWTVERPK